MRGENEMMGVQLASIMNFIMYLGVSVPILGVGIYLFIRTTPYKDFELIRMGSAIDNTRNVYAARAAALDIGGKVLGLSIVLASAIFHSVNLVDLVIWGIIGAVFEVLVFCLFRFITPFKVVEEIPKGNVAVGVFSAFLSISTGLLMAALISY